MNEEPKTSLGPHLAMLFAGAAHLAESRLREDGQLRPVLLVACAGGVLVQPHFGQLENQADKDDLMLVARAVCLAYQATAAVFMMEAWCASYADPDERKGEMPSEALHRREIVLMSGEDSSGRFGRSYPIIRRGNGNFYALGDLDELRPDSGGQVTGTFTDFLSNRTVPQPVRDLARLWLEMRGLKTMKVQR